jgi:hypothetical protein
MPDMTSGSDVSGVAVLSAQVWAETKSVFTDFGEPGGGLR